MSYSNPISPLPNLLTMAGSHLTLPPLYGADLWHTQLPVNVHTLILPAGHVYTSTGAPSAADLQVHILPLIPIPHASDVQSTLLQVATTLHAKQHLAHARLSAPSRDSVALVFHHPDLAAYPQPPWARVCVNAELDDRKDVRTGHTPRRVYVVLHVPPMVLTDEYVQAQHGTASGAALVAYADCSSGMLDTNVIGMALRDMLAKGIVL